MVKDGRGPPHTSPSTLLPDSTIQIRRRQTRSSCDDRSSMLACGQLCPIGLATSVSRQESHRHIHISLAEIDGKPH